MVMWTLKLSPLALVLFAALIDAALDPVEGGGFKAYTEGAQAPQPHLFSKTGEQYPAGLCDDIGDPWENGSFTIVFHGASSSGKSTLCCRLNGVDPQGNVGTNLGIGFTTEVKVYAENYHEDNEKIRCFTLDTPGFGETSEEGQKWVRKGIDDAIKKIHELRQGSPPAPLKRIYYAIDAHRRRDFPNLRTSLSMLSRAYSVCTRSIRFVFTKCDNPDDPNDANYFHEIVKILKDQYKDAFEDSLDDDRILFVSSHADNGCLGQIRDDILAAAHDPNLDLVPNGVSIVDEFSQAQSSLRRLTSEEKKSAERVKEYETHIETLQKQEKDKKAELVQLRRSIDQDSKLIQAEQSEVLDLINKEHQLQWFDLAAISCELPISIPFLWVPSLVSAHNSQAALKPLYQAITNFAKARDERPCEPMNDYIHAMLSARDEFCNLPKRTAQPHGTRIVKFIMPENLKMEINELRKDDGRPARISDLIDQIVKRSQTISEDEPKAQKLEQEVDDFARRLKQAENDLKAEEETHSNLQDQKTKAQENLDRLTLEASS